VDEKKVPLTELREEDLPFLLELWHTPEVMRYADEFPWLRGWSKADSLAVAWEKHQQKRIELGIEYVQFLLGLNDGTLIGESFFVSLPEGDTFGKWVKPAGKLCMMGDIKLMPERWGQGLGTAGMRQVVSWLFSNTKCDLLVVPPHRKNPAAQRVYEKAGFELFTGMRSWQNHKIMELDRPRYEAIYLD